RGEHERAEGAALAPPSAHGERARLAVFFFQAEDGIRDLIVTGVQTCALPISSDTYLRRHRCRRQLRVVSLVPALLLTIPTLSIRSEERRVGKECRSRGSRQQ